MRGTDDDWSGLGYKGAPVRRGFHRPDEGRPGWAQAHAAGVKVKRAKKELTQAELDEWWAKMARQP